METGLETVLKLWVMEDIIVVGIGSAVRFRSTACREGHVRREFGKLCGRHALWKVWKRGF